MENLPDNVDTEPAEQPIFDEEVRYRIHDGLDKDGSVFGSREQTVLNDVGSTGVRREIGRYRLGCSHTVVDPTESAICGFCDTTLCLPHGCANRRCQRCARIICDNHTRVLRDVGIFCTRCGRIVLAQRIAWKFVGL